MDERTEPTMTPIKGHRCDWAMVDRYGELYPHDIKATHAVLGTGLECMDGVYCRRHAHEAIRRARAGIGVAI